MSLCVSDERWPLAPDPFRVPLPGSHPAPRHQYLQPPQDCSGLTLPPGGGPRLLPIRAACVSVFCACAGMDPHPLDDTPQCRCGEWSSPLLTHPPHKHCPRGTPTASPCNPRFPPSTSHWTAETEGGGPGSWGITRRS